MTVSLYNETDFIVWQQPETTKSSIIDMFKGWLRFVKGENAIVKIAIETEEGAHFFKQCSKDEAFKLGVEVGSHNFIKELHLGVYVHECPMQIREFVQGAYSARADNSQGKTDSLKVYALKEVLVDNSGIKSLALQKFLLNGDAGEWYPIEDLVTLGTAVEPA